jgi:Holliday junction resolvase RusA-like endonuclease
MSEWRLEFPAPAKWLSGNSRTDRRAQTSDRQQWRNAAIVWARHRKLPKNLQRIAITATGSFPTNRNRDVDNLAPTVKVVLDGLKIYGLVPDDHSRHVTAVEYRISDRRSVTPLGSLVLEIREVP